MNDEHFGLNRMDDSNKRPLIKRRRGKANHRIRDRIPEILCNICKEWLPVDFFHKRRSLSINPGHSGRQNACIECYKKNLKKYNAKKKATAEKYLLFSEVYVKYNEIMKGQVKNRSMSLREFELQMYEEGKTPK